MQSPLFFFLSVYLEFLMVSKVRFWIGMAASVPLHCRYCNQDSIKIEK